MEFVLTHEKPGLYSMWPEKIVLPKFSYINTTLFHDWTRGSHGPVRKSAEMLQRNLHTISRIYNLTVYPNNVPVITNVRGAVPSGLFNENATGRVTPVGTFSGFQDSIEYFFGLAPIPHPPTNIAFSKADVVEFTSGCPEVASSVVYLTASVHDPGQPDDGRFVAILKEVATWHFDPSGAVLYYDAFIPTLQNWTSLALGGVDLLNREYQTAAIEGICAATQQRCVGANTQYTSVAVCVQTLAQKPFGDYDETWGDNVVCRSLHIILTLIRPDVSGKKRDV
ncbi:hypothetical protein MMC19_007728 [Ptychographa xylographoides]|nr:hypothetical protein [Ptychographa xylographoides]